METTTRYIIIIVLEYQAMVIVIKIKFQKIQLQLWWLSSVVILVPWFE